MGFQVEELTDLDDSWDVFPEDPLKSFLQPTPKTQPLPWPVFEICNLGLQLFCIQLQLHLQALLHCPIQVLGCPLQGSQMPLQKFCIDMKMFGITLPIMCQKQQRHILECCVLIISQTACT